MTIHFISCAFVFCIRVDKTAVFSALFLKPSHITEMQRSFSTFRWRHNLRRLCQNSTLDSKIYLLHLRKYNNKDKLEELHIVPEKYGD